MRIITLIWVLLMITSCGSRETKQAAQNEQSIKLEYLLKGEQIAKLAQSELLKNVSSAIGEGGPGYAIDFCNLHALALKDSLSHLNNCQIRRISLRYRNPADKPQTIEETEQLNRYQMAHEEGKSIKPEIYLYHDRIEYYQPITIAMEACLICHGDPDKQIADETLGKINARYPGDLATGFAMNDFRGAWKITFIKN